MRILVAEDDADTAGIIARGLGELGHNIVATENGVDALHLLSTEQFDVAVLDRMLPQLDGLSIVQRIRAAEIDVPILLLTALGRIEDRVCGLEAGADDYLVKPFAFSELAARVNALGRRKPLKSEPTTLEHGGVAIDLLKRRVRRDGPDVRLPRTPAQPRAPLAAGLDRARRSQAVRRDRAGAVGLRCPVAPPSARPTGTPRAIASSAE